MTTNRHEPLNQVLLTSIRKSDLTTTQYDLAAHRYQAKEKYLAVLGSPLARFDRLVFPKGSIALGAAIKPIGRDDFDLEIRKQRVLSRRKLLLRGNRSSSKSLIGALVEGKKRSRSFKMTNLMVVSCMMLLAGCASMQPGNDPSRIALLDVSKADVREVCDEQEVADEASLKKCANNILAFVDDGYYKYKRQLYQKGKLEGMIFDLLSLSVTSATALVTGKRSKHNLSVFSTLLDGTRSVSDKTVLQSNLDAIVRQMDRDREDIRREIENEIEGGFEAHSLVKLMAEADRYYLAGTIPQAIRKLAESAERGERAEEVIPQLQPLIERIGDSEYDQVEIQRSLDAIVNLL